MPGASLHFSFYSSETYALSFPEVEVEQQETGVLKPAFMTDDPQIPLLFSEIPLYGQRNSSRYL